VQITQLKLFEFELDSCCCGNNDGCFFPDGLLSQKLESATPKTKKKQGKSENFSKFFLKSKHLVPAFSQKKLQNT